MRGLAERVRRGGVCTVISQRNVNVRAPRQQGNYSSALHAGNYAWFLGQRGTLKSPGKHEYYIFNLLI